MRMVKFQINLFTCFLFVLLTVQNAQAKRIAYYFYYDNNNKHQYEDNNVKVFMEYSGIYVYNKTDQIIYIDKANSFAVLNDTYNVMFDNTVTTSGTSSNSGLTVNLGAINSLLSGYTINGGRGSYNQTTTYEKRIYSLPPKTQVEIYTWKSPFELMALKGNIIDNGNKSFPLTPRSRYVEPGTGKKIKLTKGFIRTFDLQTSPLRQKALITYALSEDMKGAKEVSTDENYLKAMVADSYKGWSGYRTEKIPYCAPFVSDKENYTHWSRYKEGSKLEDWEELGVWVVGLPLAFLGLYW